MLASFSFEGVIRGMVISECMVLKTSCPIAGREEMN
jgi:hypothetical protein